MAPKKNYTQEQMRLAIEAVHKGEKISTAAANFGVPRVTLHNKITGKSPVDCAMGPSTKLTKDEEKLLETWILLMLEKHIPITKEELLDSVQRIITDKQEANPFVNNRPGEKWYTLFMKRHPILTERTAQNLTTARDNVTVEDVEGWFKEVVDYLKEKKLLEVLEKPERIFNTDESAFFLAPKPGKVLAKKGEKHVYNSSGDEKENLTALVTGNAAGKLAPTMVVYDYERIPAVVSSCFPENWAIGRSQSGWMCGHTFFEYIANVFNPWVEQQGIEKPILFFLDGHKSHLTMHLSNFCTENGIEIIALNPNSTHIIQPMDISVFRPLKLSWKKAVNAWKMENPGRILKKPQFAPVLEGALKTISAETIQNGFRAAGLCPFGPEYVDMSKIKTRNEKKEETVQTRGQDFLKMLEMEMNKTFSISKLQLFNNLYLKNRNQLEELLPQEDQSLYLIWAKTKQSLTALPFKRMEYNDTNVNETSDRIGSEVLMVEPENQKNIKSKEYRLEAEMNEEKSIADPLPDAGPENQKIKTNIRQTKEPEIEVEMDNDTLNYKIMETEHSRSHLKEQESEIEVTTAAGREINYPKITITPENTKTKSLQLEGTCHPKDLEKVVSSDAPLMQQIDITTAITTKQIDQKTETQQLKTIINDNMQLPQKTPKKNPIPSTSKSCCMSGLVVPSPFKRNLFWPEDIERKSGKKRRLKEKIPSAITGTAWREYNEKKETEKILKQEEKENRAKERREKKIMKEKLLEVQRKKKNKKIRIRPVRSDVTSSETETEIRYAESDDSCWSEKTDYDDEISVKHRKKNATDTDSDNVPLSIKSSNGMNLRPGNFVIVIYEGQHFPGVVKRVAQDAAEVSTMTFSTGNSFKWPDKTDTLWYQKKDIVENIKPPVLTNKRGFYSVKQMEKYLLFIA